MYKKKVPNPKLITEWRDCTLELLNKRPRSIQYEDIEKSTGLQKAWLTLFARGKIDGPSVNAMNTLHNYLISVMNDNNDISEYSK